MLKLCKAVARDIKSEMKSGVSTESESSAWAEWYLLSLACQLAQPAHEKDYLIARENHMSISVWGSQRDYGKAKRMGNRGNFTEWYRVFRPKFVEN